LFCKPETVVFMKAYRNVGDILSAVDEAESYHDCVGISKCGLPEEEVLTDLEQLTIKPPNYWTLIIAKQKKRGNAMKPKPAPEPVLELVDPA
jgi:precorrin-2/cobalt-factor-2 C20-methyltransferase